MGTGNAKASSKRATIGHPIRHPLWGQTHPNPCSVNTKTTSLSVLRAKERNYFIEFFNSIYDSKISMEEKKNRSSCTTWLSACFIGISLPFRERQFLGADFIWGERNSAVP